MTGRLTVMSVEDDWQIDTVMSVEDDWQIDTVMSVEDDWHTESCLWKMTGILTVMPL